MITKFTPQNTVCGIGKIEDDQPIDLKEYAFIPNSTIEMKRRNRMVSKKDSFSLKIGGTVFEVSTHFSKDGRQCVLEQFRDLILSGDLI